MASNHTPATAKTDKHIAEFFWTNGYSEKYPSVKKKDFLTMAESGDLQISSVMENFVTHHNPKLKRSNLDGEDHCDGSDDKYMSTRIRLSKQKYTKKTTGEQKVYVNKTLGCHLSPSSLKNKKGTLRIAINLYNPDNNTSDILMFRIPYPEWKSSTIANGYLHFEFRMDGSLTPITEKRFAKYLCKTIKQFCK